MPECTLARGDVYQRLLEAKGGYDLVYARPARGDESVHGLDDEPFRPIIDWIVEGKGAHMEVHHVWGLGGNQIYTGIRDRFYYWCYDRKEFVLTRSVYRNDCGGRGLETIQTDMATSVEEIIRTPEAMGVNAA